MMPLFHILTFIYRHFVMMRNQLRLLHATEKRAKHLNTPQWCLRGTVYFKKLLLRIPLSLWNVCDLLWLNTISIFFALCICQYHRVLCSTRGAVAVLLQYSVSVVKTEGVCLVITFYFLFLLLYDLLSVATEIPSVSVTTETTGDTLQQQMFLTEKSLMCHCGFQVDSCW